MFSKSGESDRQGKGNRQKHSNLRLGVVKQRVDKESKLKFYDVL